MKERSILAYFPSEGKAASAQSELINYGFETVQLDRVSLFPDDDSWDVANPLTSDFGSLSRLTLGTTPESEDEGVLLAAHPDSSGMAMAPEPQGTPYLITVVCPEGQVDQAVSILKKYGANV